MSMPPWPLVGFGGKNLVEKMIQRTSVESGIEAGAIGVVDDVATWCVEDEILPCRSRIENFIIVAKERQIFHEPHWCVEIEHECVPQIVMC